MISEDPFHSVSSWGALCFLQRTWGEVKSPKQRLHFPSVLFQEECGRCQACSSATVVTWTRASLPAVLGLVAIKFPSSPLLWVRRRNSEK